MYIEKIKRRNPKNWKGDIMKKEWKITLELFVIGCIFIAGSFETQRFLREKYNIYEAEENRWFADGKEIGKMKSGILIGDKITAKYGEKVAIEGRELTLEKIKEEVSINERIQEQETTVWKGNLNKFTELGTLKVEENEDEYTVWIDKPTKYLILEGYHIEICKLKRILPLKNYKFNIVYHEGENSAIFMYPTDSEHSDVLCINIGDKNCGEMTSQQLQRVHVYWRQEIYTDDIFPFAWRNKEIGLYVKSDSIQVWMQSEYLPSCSCLDDIDPYSLSLMGELACFSGASFWVGILVFCAFVYSFTLDIILR